MKKYSTSKRFVIIVIALVIGSLLYTNIFYNTMRERVLSMLSEIAYQSTQVLKKEVEKGEAVLSNVADYIAQEDLDTDYILTKLDTLNDDNFFKRMGIVDLEGVGRTTDGLIMDLSDRDYFLKGLNGYSSISGTIIDKSDGKEINVFSAPIIKEGEVVALLFATYATDYYRNLLTTTIFNGQGYTYVIDNKGDRVIASNNKNSKIDFTNFYDALNEDKGNEATAKKLRTAIEHNETGNLTYTYGVGKYMDYRPLEINNWYVLTIIPDEVIATYTNSLMLLSASFALICVGAISYLVVYIYKQKEKNQRDQEEMIFTDALTGGMSQTRFKLEARSLIKHPDASYAIVVMDIEKFKYINDLYGFSEGDVVLKKIYDILYAQLNKHELCARQSGDHFILLLHIDERNKFTQRLENLQQQLLHCHEFDHQEYEIKAKFGICLAIEESDSLETMIDHADLALNLIKKEVMYSVSYYDDQLKEKLLQIKMIENKFELAINNREFILYYQPKYNLHTNRFDGGEALVRWKNSDGNFITPNQFIPIFESNGSIIKLDRYVFEEVCHSISEWLKAGLPVGAMSINVSRLDLYSPVFVDDYLHIIEKYQIPSELIQLEITETALFDNNEEMLSIINRLHDYGIAVLMDDFGTGYSSVSMIKDIPIDVLKIDKSLIDDSLTNDRGQIIVKMIIDLCHQFDIKVTAEGVETKEQFDLLRVLGCDYIQGYYCAKPMDLEAYIHILMELSNEG